MEEVSVKIDAMSLDKTGTVVVDIESLLLQQPSDRSSGSPKMIKALSRKWSYRAERLASADEEDIDESSKKTLLKVNSLSEKQSLLGNKVLNSSSSATLGNHSGGSSTGGSSSNVFDADGWNKKFNRIMCIKPRKILCIFATMSSVGSLILIYFALAINGSF